MRDAAQSISCGHRACHYAIAGILGLAGLFIGISIAALSAHLMAHSSSLLPLLTGTILSIGIGLVTLRAMFQVLEHDEDAPGS